MAEATATGDARLTVEEVTQQATDDVSRTLTSGNPMDVEAEDTSTTVTIVAADLPTAGEGGPSTEDLATQEIQVTENSVQVVFAEEGVEVPDGPQVAMDQQDIPVEYSPDGLNDPGIEPMQERDDNGQAMDVVPQLLEEQVQNDDQPEQHQQEAEEQAPEDVSPSSDSVEPFGSRQVDQELQVVPDSSAGAASDRSRFVTENLHEAMEFLVNRQSPATLALGVQMVPTSATDAAVDGLHVLQTMGSEEQQQQQQEQHQEQEQERQMVTDERNHQVEGERQAVPVNEPSGGAALDDQQQPALYAFQQAENTYEVCLTMPAADEHAQLQDIPVDLQGWTELSAGQSLVAVAEDGTTIPLAVFRQGTDVELSYDSANGDNLNEVQQILQQLTNGSLQPLASSTLPQPQLPQPQLSQPQLPHQVESASVILNVDQVQPQLVTGTVERPILELETVAGSSQQLDDVIHIPEQACEVSRKVALPANASENRRRRTVARKPSTKSRMATKTDIVQETVNETSTAVDGDGGGGGGGGGGETVEMVVELSNTTPSAISPENMQTLIEILQSLPATARGQTIQIILQTEPTARPADVVVAGNSAEVANTSVTITPYVHVTDDADVTMMKVVKKLNSKRPRTRAATSDIAVQVTPEFIENDQKEKSPSPPSPPPPLAPRQEEEAREPLADVANEKSKSPDKVADKDAADKGALSEDEKSRQIMAAIMESSRKRRAFRKKNSKQIVTVEEQWVTDPKPGVSYYAVIDYLSEQDQDGFSSASEMKRPEALSSAFMEDHLELQNGVGGSGGLIDDLSKNRSILESTIDSSTIVSPYRRQVSIGRMSVLEVSHKSKTVTTNSKTIDLPPTESLGDESGVTLQQKSFDRIDLNGGEVTGDGCGADAGDNDLAAAVADQPQPAADESAVSANLRPRKKRLTKKPSTPRRGTATATVTTTATGTSAAALSRSTSKVRYEHKCGYCGYDSADKILVVEHCLAAHPDLPMRTLSLLPQTIGRTCPYCRQHFEHTEFFAHMRFAHSEVHPYKCGYCDFMGRDRNQIRHHIQKKHRLPMKVINLLDPNRPLSHRHEDVGGSGGGDRQLKYGGSGNGGGISALSEGEESVYEYRTDEEEMDDLDEDDATAADPRRGLSCPECKKTFKTLKYLKTHIKVHQPHRYQCGYCSFYSIMLHQVLRHCQKKHSDVDPKVLTKELEPDKNPIVSRDMDDVIKKVFSLNTRLPRDPDQTKWMRKWFCPHCDYTCQFGASYRRHLRMHANILPYKCNYCSFKGRERYYVRRHISRMHPELPGIVVENNPENCAHDTSSDEGFQEKGLRRKRHRRPKDSLHAVVPVDDMDSDTMQEQYQQQPRRKKKSGNGRWTSEVDSDTASVVDAKATTTTTAAVPTKVVHNRAAKFPRVALASGRSDVVPEKDGETIVCRACNQKVAAKGFQQHAKNHFKKIVPLKCAHCNYMSVTRSNIEKHSRDKHHNLPFGTEECHLASLAPRDFVALIGGGEEVDVASEDPEPPRFTCPLCQTMVDYDEDTLSGHFYAHFEYFPYACGLCDHQDVSQDKVRQHSALVHGGDVPYSIQSTLQEKPDGLEDTIQLFLREGQEIVQAKLTELMEKEQQKQQQQQQQQQESCPDVCETDNASESVSHVFVCPICQAQMDLKTARLRHHLHDHFSYKPFKCADCRYVSLRRGRIRRHATREHGHEARIELSNRVMPDDLSKMLHEIDQELKVIKGHGAGKEDNNDDDDDDGSQGPKSDVAKAWLDNLSHGQCPWCKFTASDTGELGLRDHAMSHFGGKAHVCVRCDKSFVELCDAMRHAAQEHPGLEVGVTVDVSEIAVRRGLATILAETKAKSMESPVEGTVTDATAKPAKDIYEFDDNDIVTVEGVLLTRTFRSGNEASDDDDDVRSSETESDDSDLLIGDVDPQLVSDIRAILNQSSFLRRTDERQPELKETSAAAPTSAAVGAATDESPFVQLFVCGYCDFYSEEQDVTKAHTDENHLKSGILESVPPEGHASSSKVPSPPVTRAKKRAGCPAGGVKSTGSDVTKQPRHDTEVQETVEDIMRLVVGDVEYEVGPHAEKETLDNIVKTVQSTTS